MKEPFELFKERETGEIITDSLSFLKNEWKPILRLTVIYVLPFILLYAVAQLFMQVKLAASVDLVQETDPEKLIQKMGPVYIHILITLLFNIFVQSLFLAVVYTYLQVYIVRGRGNFTDSDISPLLFTNSLVTLSASLVVAMIAVSGMFFFIFPGLILANYLSLSIIIALFERKGISNALQRSWFLVSRKWWNTLSLNLLGVLIVWSASFIFSLPLDADSIRHFTGVSGDMNDLDFSNWKLWLMVASVVVSSIASILPFLFLAFQYFNLAAAERKSL